MQAGGAVLILPEPLNQFPEAAIGHDLAHLLPESFSLPLILDNQSNHLLLVVIPSFHIGEALDKPVELQKLYSRTEIGPRYHHNNTHMISSTPQDFVYTP